MIHGRSFFPEASLFSVFCLHRQKSNFSSVILIFGEATE
jgi:hypothetical protein